MTERKFIYVDGESHFIRSKVAWQELNGEQATLSELRYKDESNSNSVLVLPKANVFWTRRMDPGASRATYFTSAACDDNDWHSLCVKIRGFDLEPHVLKELKQLAKQRANLLGGSNLIEKPKGVDISLAVRMLEDSYNQAFDVCHLYTSDVDFIPVIQAIKARGKKVVVFGYQNGISSKSDLLHVPDRFINLAEVLSSDCVNDAATEEGEQS